VKVELLTEAATIEAHETSDPITLPCLTGVMTVPDVCFIQIILWGPLPLVGNHSLFLLFGKYVDHDVLRIKHR